MLLFCPAEQVEVLLSTLRHYALQDSGDEAGAAEHRCDVVYIDKARGTAAGYVAKYVSKNIDGEHVGEDLEGRSAVESAKRVEAWCSTWGIRQFQQVGGPPVSVWRELRRIPKLPDDAPEHLQRAHRAANKQIQRAGDEAECVDWSEYCRAQGGMDCGRKAAIKVAMRQVDVPGRYGDSVRMCPVGIETVGLPCSADCPATGAARTWLVESERHVWTIERAPAKSSVATRGFFAVAAQPAQPWTRVNNCTELAARDRGNGLSPTDLTFGQRMPGSGPGYRRAFVAAVPR